MPFEHSAVLALAVAEYSGRAASLGHDLVVNDRPRTHDGAVKDTWIEGGEVKGHKVSDSQTRGVEHEGSRKGSEDRCRDASAIGLVPRPSFRHVDSWLDGVLDGNK
jgi:hypothetical protein